MAQNLPHGKMAAQGREYSLGGSDSPQTAWPNEGCHNILQMGVVITEWGRKRCTASDRHPPAHAMRPQIVVTKMDATLLLVCNMKYMKRARRACNIEIAPLGTSTNQPPRWVLCTHGCRVCNPLEQEFD